MTVEIGYALVSGAVVAVVTFAGIFLPALLIDLPNVAERVLSRTGAALGQRRSSSGSSMCCGGFPERPGSDVRRPSGRAARGARTSTREPVGRVAPWCGHPARPGRGRTAGRVPAAPCQPLVRPSPAGRPSSRPTERPSS